MENNLDLQETEPQEVKPAGFWIRLVAYFVDSLILMVPSVAAVFIGNVTLYLVVAAVTIGYKPILEGFLGGTAGKLALNLEVQSITGQPIGLITAIIRNGIFILPLIPNVIIQLKMFEQGIGPLNENEVMQFNEQHELLFIASYGFSFLTVFSCSTVLLSKKKRALHDWIGQTRVVKLAKQTEV